jgi:hypothetical protein
MKKEINLTTLIDKTCILSSAFSIFEANLIAENLYSSH